MWALLVLLNRRRISVGVQNLYFQRVNVTDIRVTELVCKIASYPRGVPRQYSIVECDGKTNTQTIGAKRNRAGIYWSCKGPPVSFNVWWAYIITPPVMPLCLPLVSNTSSERNWHSESRWSGVTASEWGSTPSVALFIQIVSGSPDSVRWRLSGSIAAAPFETVRNYSTSS